MSKAWKSISVDEAKESSLYGVGGWLVVFAISVFFGLIVAIGTLHSEANKADSSLSDFLTIDHPAITFIKGVLLVHMFSVAAIYWLLLTKHQRFRIAASCLLLAAWPVTACIGLINTFSGAGVAIGSSFLPWAISCAVWVSYLNLSRRVRVTFEHLIPEGERESTSSSDEDSSSTQHEIPASPLSSVQPHSPISNRVLTNVLSKNVVCKPSDYSVTDTDEVLWATSLAEFEGRERRPGLWAKSYSEAGGDELVAKAVYLKSRVRELQSEREKASAEQKRIDRQREARERLNKMSEEARIEALTPKGQCPNCDIVLPLTAEKCPKCAAMFGPSAAWKLIPVRGILDN